MADTDSLPGPDGVAEYLNEVFSNDRNGINLKLKVDAGIGLMLYWVGYELNRLTDAITGAPTGVPLQDEAPPVPGEGAEEGSQEGEGGPMDADAIRQDEDRD